MYKIEIKKHETLHIEEGVKFSTKNIIYMALNSSPKDGMSDEEGKIRQKIRDAVTELKEKPILILEDHDFKTLLDIINTMGKKNPDGTLKATGWGLQNTMIWDFCDEMRELKSFKAAELAELPQPSKNGSGKGKLTKAE